jgi:Protein of unknown function (DUF2934)
MADDKPRAARARKKTATAETEVVTGEATAKRRTRVSTALSGAKPAAKKRKASTAPPRTAPVAVGTEDVALLAYLLWERGAPGDATEHWLRAEQELAAA